MSVIWQPKDSIYYEKARQVVADYYSMNKSISAVAKKWFLSERMVRHYLTLLGVELPPRRRDKTGRFIS